MASQLISVTGNRRLKPDQTAALNSRLSLLPQIMANKQREEDLMRADELKDIQMTQFSRQMQLGEREIAMTGERLQLERDLASQAKKERRAEMGLEAGKLGLNIAMSPAGGKTLGGLFGSAKSSLTGGSPGTGFQLPGSIGGLTLGSTIGAGIAGYGLGRAIEGKKTKKAAIGAGAGALLGLLGSGIGGGFMGTATGSLFGGLGGLLG